MSTMESTTTPLVLILDRAHRAKFVRQVPSTLPLHGFVAMDSYRRTVFLFCQGDHYATGRGLTAIELRLGIRAAVEGTTARRFQWSLVVDDIGGIEHMIRAEALRACEVGGTHIGPSVTPLDAC